MEHNLVLYNTLNRKKEKFEPLSPPFVGMYVCGPTVYSDVHLGNCRTFTSFDILYRYLTHLGYKVRYVRNITDVGHLVDDADEGEDKIGKKARLENLEPMEVVQRYTNGFHAVMLQLNNLEPSIEPSATGHIIEQIEMARALVEKGYAYESNGSIYFDVEKFSEKYEYGKLSGRIVEELVAGNRELDGQQEKRNSNDFALWKKASKEHIMRWPSPWGDGFPGWHIECSVMSAKYLGKTFDIHGGGIDLKFPHHECEIAQSVGTYGNEPCKYWIHTNMLTVNGQRMGKSKGNSILPAQLFNGDHPLLNKAYSPMTLRFFMLQTHYRSTMDITNDALFASQKGYLKLMNGLKLIKNLEFVSEGKDAKPAIAEEINKLCSQVSEAMDDDLNTALAIGHLFNLLKKINSIQTGQILMDEIGVEAFEKMKHCYVNFLTNIFGLREEKEFELENMLSMLIEVYKQAKLNREYQKVDEIRAGLKTQGIVLKDMKTGIDWSYEE